VTPSRDRLAALIRGEVRATGLAQRNIAALAGITEKHLSEIINGHTVPSLDVVDRILAAVGRELVLVADWCPVAGVPAGPPAGPVASQAKDADSVGKVHT
jgi:transcriptional regulator with XRE-family HTH domain